MVRVINKGENLESRLRSFFENEKQDREQACDPDCHFDAIKPGADTEKPILQRAWFIIWI